MCEREQQQWKRHAASKFLKLSTQKIKKSKTVTKCDTERNMLKDEINNTNKLLFSPPFMSNCHLNGRDKYETPIQHRGERGHA